MKKIIEGIAIWLGISWIYVCYLYCLKWKLNMSILWHDVKTILRDCSGVMRLQFLVPIIILLIIIIIIFTKHDAYIFNINITVNKKKTFDIRVCYLQFIHKYATWLTIFVIIASVAVGATAIMNTKRAAAASNYLNNPMVIHAMGEIDGFSYSNSREAFELHYSNGQRMFETDFCLTADDIMVARHDWGAGWQEGIDEEHIPTESVFLSKPVFGKYTPLTLKDIILLMQQYPDIYIITDTKDEQSDLARKEIGMIVQTAKEMQAEDVLDRFVIQIYSPEMYEAIKDIYHFPNYIFTLYMIWTKDVDEFISYCRFCNANSIKTITMWDHRLKDNPHLGEIARQYGVKIYVHTVNDQATAEEVEKIGASGIYTDNEKFFDNTLFTNIQ